MILHLGLGQSGFLDGRPHHRLGPLIERAVHQELHELIGDHSLGVIVHGDIRIDPVAGDAQTLELFTLDVDPALGELAAFLTEIDDVHLVLVLALLAVLLFDLPLDGQAVAVPAGHVARVEAHHLMRPHDHVFDGLVQRVTDMQVTVCVGGAVMQGKGRTTLFLAQAVIYADLLPALQPCGLAFGQARAHGEVGFGQVQRVFVVRCFGAHLGRPQDDLVVCGSKRSVRGLKHLCPASRGIRAPGI